MYCHEICQLGSRASGQALDISCRSINNPRRAIAAVSVRRNDGLQGSCRLAFESSTCTPTISATPMPVFNMFAHGSVRLTNDVDVGRELLISRRMETIDRRRCGVVLRREIGMGAYRILNSLFAACIVRMEVAEGSWVRALGCGFRRVGRGEVLRRVSGFETSWP